MIRNYDGPNLDDINEIRRHMDALAGVWARLPAEKWAGYVAYLLEELEAADVDEHDIVHMLTDLQSDIGQRLETGRWPNGETP